MNLFPNRVWEDHGNGFSSREPHAVDKYRRRCLERWLTKQCTYKEAMEDLSGYIADKMGAGNE